MILEHQSVSSMKKSVPVKLRALGNAQAKFLILRDNDNGNCGERKPELLEFDRQGWKVQPSKGLDCLLVIWKRGPWTIHIP